MRLSERNPRIQGMRIELLLGLMVADQVLREHGTEAIITSALDGQHGPRSLHYAGHAVDLRIWYLRDKEGAVEEMRARLGPDYDVVLETTHIHLEYQPEYQSP